MSTLEELALEYRQTAAQLALAIERTAGPGTFRPGSWHSCGTCWRNCARRSAPCPDTMTCPGPAWWMLHPGQPERGGKMTIEALRARRARLIEQKQKEQTLLEQGQGDNMALFMVNEELLEVNAQIRSLSGTQRRIGRRNTSADAAKLSVDRALYRAWAQSQGEGRRDLQPEEMLQQILTGAKIS